MEKIVKKIKTENNENLEKEKKHENQILDEK
jgi:hypothetical protein